MNLEKLGRLTAMIMMMALPVAVVVMAFCAVLDAFLGL